MTNKITLINNAKIIDNKYVIKKKKDNTLKTYSYLLSRSFNYMPEIIKEDDNYIYYKYINDIDEPDEQKIIDLIYLISLLHSKTTYYKEIDLDKYKEIYENINKEIDDTYNYYNHLMDNIEQDIYMSPANYLIARNISIIYKNLVYAKDNINKWYKIIEDKRKIRVVTIHNNLLLEHYLKDENKSYLISWDKSRRDMPIYDLVSLYKNNYLDFEFTSLLKIYLSKYPLTKEEMLLFLTLIAIPSKIKYEETEYKNVLNIRRIIDYIYKTDNILKEYCIKQETDKSKKL